MKFINNIILNSLDIAPSTKDGLFDHMIEDSLAYYPFTNSITENSKGDNATILAGTPTLETYNYPLVSSSDSLTGVRFDASSYLSIDNITSTFNTGEILTLSFFVRFEQLNPRNFIFGLNDNSNAYQLIQGYMEGSILKIRAWGVSAQIFQCNLSGFNTNRWYYIVLTFSETGFKLYVDGVYKNNDANFTIGNENIDFTISNYNIDKFVLGSAYGGGVGVSPVSGEAFLGTLSHFMIFNRYLSNSEIAEKSGMLYTLNHNLGSVNLSRSLMTFNNIDMVNVLGYGAYDKYDEFILVFEYAKFNPSTSVSGDSKNIDVYVTCTGDQNNQYVSNRELTKDQYLFSISSNFSSGLVLNSDYLKGASVKINKRQFINFTIKYKNRQRFSQPMINPNDIYPNFLYKIGIYGCETF